VCVSGKTLISRATVSRAVDQSLIVVGSFVFLILKYFFSYLGLVTRCYHGDDFLMLCGTNRSFNYIVTKKPIGAYRYIPGCDDNGRNVSNVILLLSGCFGLSNRASLVN